MPQLLVRNLEASLVRQLKQRAKAHGLSTEEEHRRILREAVSGPAQRRPGLMDFLLAPDNTVAPEVELDLRRSRKPEQRETGF